MEFSKIIFLAKYIIIIFLVKISRANFEEKKGRKNLKKIFCV